MSRWFRGLWAQTPAHGIGKRLSEALLKKLSFRPLLSLASLCIFPAALRAEPPDLFQLRASAGVEHDSNVVRVGTQEESDTIGILSVGAKFDRSYSLQHFRADIEASKYWYNSHPEFDYSTLNYNAAWDWRATPAFHGVLSAERRQFRDITDATIPGLTEVGVRTERVETAEGIYDIDAVWRALAGVLHTANSTTLPVSWDASPTIGSARIGGGYEWASGSSLFARYRRGDGEYTQQRTTTTPADFRESEADLALKWVLTGKTSLDAQLGHLQRTHAGAPARDFSGPIGSATVNWNATGKTTVVAGLARYLGSTGLDTGGHVVSDRIFVGPVWKATALTTVNARYDRTVRNWEDVPTGAPDIGRRDVAETASIGIDWEPRRSVTVSASVRGERVKSNVPGASYRNTAVGAGVKVAFF
jgi:exopolysaccharide biosynthesis operon protein EpsL